MTADTDLSHTSPLSYSVDRAPLAITVPKIKTSAYPIVDSADMTRFIELEVRTEKNSKESFVMLNISDLSKKILDAREGVHNSFIVYKKLGKVIDLSNYFSVSKETVESVENTTIALDNTIDKLEDIIDNSSFGLNKFIMNLDLNRALTLQFILSNKVADYYSEDHKN